MIIFISPHNGSIKLQRVLNAAARLVKFDRGLERLLHDDLHWLDVPERVQFKLGMTVRRRLRRTAPLYLVDYCTSVADVVSRQHLYVPPVVVSSWCRVTVSTRSAFAVAGPMSWNSLPNSLRESACDDNISDDCFKHSLKTFLFSGY